MDEFLVQVFSKEGRLLLQSAHTDRGSARDAIERNFAEFAKRGWAPLVGSLVCRRKGSDGWWTYEFDGKTWDRPFRD